MSSVRNPFDLTGRVALVTGAYRGLGFAIARGLAEAGARVILNGRKRRCARGARRAVACRRRHRAPTSRCSTSPMAAPCAQGVAAAAQREHGAIDILVNNAGIQRRRAARRLSRSRTGTTIIAHQPDGAVPGVAGGAAGDDRGASAARSSTSRR